MALTIAVGFVVDDAIVMLENIYRHIEDGLTPMEATLKGAGEIGFTILTISISLVAVFIPLLLMGGIVGRLFREFAITLTMTIAVSAFVALTLSPTMCAIFLRDEKHVRHGKAYMVIERAFDRILAWYKRGLTFVLAHQPATLVVFICTVALTWCSISSFPRVFSAAGHRNHRRSVRCAAGHLLHEMVRRQHLLTDIIARDPDVASYGAFIGGSRPVNTGFLILGLKPRDERKASADQIIVRLRKEIAQVPGATAFLQAAQDLNVAAAPRARSISTPCRMRTSANSITGRQNCWPRSPGCRSCAIPPPTSRPTYHAVPGHRSRSGRAFRHPAVSDRPDA